MSHQFQVFLPAMFLILGCSASNRLTVQETARPFSLPIGAPNYSDVCFSSRWERPRDSNDTLETFSAMRNFHGTYLTWVYTTNPLFIKKADSLGYKVQTTLSGSLPDLPIGNTSLNQGRILNKSGQKVTASWMRTWESWWGCVNHPEFQEIWKKHLKAVVESGASSIQVDGPAMNYLFIRNLWEDVCYCEYCVKKAAALGKQPNEIQQQSVSEFYAYMKKYASDIAGHPIPFSCNNFEGDWELFPFSDFDFGVAEIGERRANPEYLYATIKEGKKLGKAQVFTFAHERDWLVQKMIAATYACGGSMIVPWDVWQTGIKDRYFGKPKQYAPLYAFVRANAQWLDGYEDAFYANSQDDPRFVDKRSLPISFDNYRRQIHAFVRAKPSDKTAPIVVHLLDWHVLMEGFEIQLNEGRFFKKGIGSIELLTPTFYDENEHDAAERIGDFSSLVAAQTIDFQKDEKSLRLKIPKLEQHWGILVIRPKP